MGLLLTTLPHATYGNPQHAISTPSHFAPQSTVEFIITGDPQFDNANVERNRNSSKTLHATGQYLKQRPQTKGLIVLGDLTENTRPNDEWQNYKKNIAPFKKQVYDTQGNHDLIQPTWYQQLGCWYDQSYCVDKTVIAEDIRNRPRDTAICLKVSSEALYSWFWNGIYFINLGQGKFSSNVTENYPNYLNTALSRVKSTTPIVVISHYPISEKHPLLTSNKNIFLVIGAHEHNAKARCAKGYAGFIHCKSPSALAGGYAVVSINRNYLQVDSFNAIKKYARSAFQQYLQPPILMGTNASAQFNWAQCEAPSTFSRRHYGTLVTSMLALGVSACLAGFCTKKYCACSSCQKTTEPLQDDGVELAVVIAGSVCGSNITPVQTPS